MIEHPTDVHITRGVRSRGDALLATADRFLAFSVALFLLAMYLVSAVPGFSRLVHVSIGLMFVSLVLRSMASPLRLRLDPVMFSGALFATFALISVWWAADQGGALSSVIGLLFDVFGAFLVWLALQNGLSVRIIAVCAAIGASVQGLVALNQYLSSDASRAVGLTGNANSLAIQLSMSAFLLLLTVPRERWAKLFPLLLIVVATVTTGTRKLLFVWFSYAVLMVRSVSPMFRRPTVGAALVLTLSPLALWLLFNFGGVIFEPLEELTVIQRIEGTLEGRETTARSNLIESALDLWWERPLFGYGMDQFRYVSEFTHYSHNNYTELLANFGVVGFGLFYSIYLMLLIRAVPAAVRGSNTAWVILAIVLVLLLMDVARVSYTSRMTWLFFGLMGHFSLSEGRTGSPLAPRTR